MAIDRIAIALLLLLSAGCANFGAAYSDVTSPASLDFNSTPSGTKRCVINSYKLKEPVTGIGLSAEWDRNYLKSMAANAGITNLYYADIRVRSVLMGLYSQKFLILYGD